MTDPALTLAELDAAVVQARREHPSLRLGQAYVNALTALEPKCAEAIRHMSVDPFYDDRILPRFRQFVADWLGEEW